MVPNFFTFVRDLPSADLLSNNSPNPVSASASLPGTSRRRMLNMANIPDTSLEEIINSAGGLSPLSKILEFRTSKFNEFVALEEVQRSMKIDFSKLLTIGYMLGLGLKLAFIALVLASIVCSIYGMNIKSRVLHFWVYSTIVISTYFAINDFMAPVLKKFSEMIVIGWFTDIFQVNFEVQKFSSHFETIYYTRLQNLSFKFYFSLLVQLVSLVMLNASIWVA